MAERSLNKVLLIGRLGRDPEVKFLPSGQAVANFSLATSERRQDKEGNWKDRTEWHRIVLFGKQAETAGNYLHKGDRVFIEGRVQSREWDDREGQKRTTVEIVGVNMIMLSGRAEAQSGGTEAVEEISSEEDVPF